ncbi:MAG: class I SAM-dependent methyltransferase [Muribaculaceae bacterium]|nr:class I SAM-dependent methyltransferase [Muribaculaceae bacterium]
MEISEKMINFIQEHAKDDTNALRLKYDGKSNKMDFPIDFAILQIEARRKAQKKIPKILENPHFLFPDSLAAEQASNEAVARFHASLIKPRSSILDLTAGLGIDDLTFASVGINVTACEIRKDRCDILIHNSSVLGLSNMIRVYHTNSMEYVAGCKKHYDTVFSDPARRSIMGKRLHALSDCQPDILSGMDSIMNLTDRLLIKSSPMLDLTLIHESVEKLNHIYVVCIKGECKEVLIDIRKDTVFSGITVIDLDMDGVISTFKCHHSPTKHNIYTADRRSAKDYKYLYEPNAGVMKCGAWGEICHQYPGLYKADSNTHLYLSDRLFPDFPGRILNIDEILDKSSLKELKGTRYNVVARNYPQTAAEIAKKYDIISGGERYIYALRYLGKPVCLTAFQVNKETQRVAVSKNQKAL